MIKSKRIKLLSAATPDQLAAVDAVLNGKDKRPSLRLYRMGEAAEEIGLSRTTLWRAIKDRRIKTVKVRTGSYRISEKELRRFVGV